MSEANRQTLLAFFDYLVHDSVAGFGLDMSRLQNWRIMYFGNVSYVPDRSLARNDVSLDAAAAIA